MKKPFILRKKNSNVIVDFLKNDSKTATPQQTYRRRNLTKEYAKLIVTTTISVYSMNLNNFTPNTRNNTIHVRMNESEQPSSIYLSTALNMLSKEMKRLMISRYKATAAQMYSSYEYRLIRLSVS